MEKKTEIKQILWKNKVLIYILLIGLVFTLNTGSAICAINLRIVRHLSPEEEGLHLNRLKLELAGEFFRIDTKLIFDYCLRGFTSEDIISALFFSADAQRPLNTVLELQKREGDWSKVATKLGLTPNAHGMQTALTSGKGKKLGLKKKLQQENYVFTNFVSKYFNVEADRLNHYIKRGFSLDDIILAVNLSSRLGIRFEILLRERERGLDWSMILRERNIQKQSLFAAYKSEIKYQYKPLIE